MGKSSIGRRLAKAMARPFLDADALVEQESGQTIAEIFSRAGEAAFRELEHRLVERTLLSAPGVVLATGGGVVLDPRNRLLLRERAFTIHLNSAADGLVARLKRSRRRPLFEGVDVEEKLRLLHAQRAPYYAEVARLSIDVDRRSMRELIAEIAAQVARHEAVAP